MMRANQGSLAASCVLAPLLVQKFESSPLERTEGRSDCIEHKRGIDCSQTTDVVLFAAEEGRERGSSMWAGEQGYMGKFGFLLPPGLHCWTLVWTRGCAEHVFWLAPNTCPSCWEAPGVCVTLLCAFRWQSLDRWVSGKIKLGGSTECEW